MTDVLKRPSNTIERPKPLPVGTFLWQVKGLPRFDISKNQKKFVEFIVVPLQAGDDVDADLLTDSLTVKATGERKPLSEKQMKPQFYYETDFGAAMLKEFVDHCLGGESDESLEERMPQCNGTQVLGHIRHRPSQDGKGVVADIDQWAPVGS